MRKGSSGLSSSTTWNTLNRYTGPQGMSEGEKGNAMLPSLHSRPGNGDPLGRDPAAVSRDVAYGFVSPAAALASYGVVVRDAEVDAEATAAERSRLAGTRIRLRVHRTAEPEFDGTRRVVIVHPATATTLRARSGALVELLIRFEVAERIDHHGAPLASLDEAAIEAIARRLAGDDVEALALCFLHAYANPDHERRALDAVRRAAPGIAPTASHQVVPEFREYERFSTTVINAYLLPVMSRYLSTLGAALAGRGYGGAVYTMGSNGGTMDLDTVQTLPIRTILSGPVGGVTGALRVAQAEGITQFVTCDMGGTSTDVCLVEHGSPTSVNETAFVGYPIKGRQIDINTVGAGGGSIAHAEGADTLRVGPRNAGAIPGPACYGLGGTEPTITDANMVLGRIGTRRLAPREGTVEGAVIARRDAWFDEARVNVAVYEREHLPVDASFEGPAIVEEDGATTVITPGWRRRWSAWSPSPGRTAST